MCESLRPYHRHLSITPAGSEPPFCLFSFSGNSNGVHGFLQQIFAITVYVFTSVHLISSAVQGEYKTKHQNHSESQHWLASQTQNVRGHTVYFHLDENLYKMKMTSSLFHCVFSGCSSTPSTFISPIKHWDTEASSAEDADSSSKCRPSSYCTQLALHPLFQCATYLTFELQTVYVAILQTQMLYQPTLHSQQC